MNKKIRAGIAAILTAGSLGLTSCSQVENVDVDNLSDSILNGLDSLVEKLPGNENNIKKGDPEFEGANFEELTEIKYGVVDGEEKQISKEPLRGSMTVVDPSIGIPEHDPNDDTFYTVVGKADVDIKLTPQEVKYGELDSKGRATGVWAMITDDMYNHSAGGPRYPVEYKDNPTGYVDNQKVSITNGTKTYNGYFYNRSHLLGDSLGGRFFENNLVTGTRMQNVGWNGTPEGGMRYPETLVENHFKSVNKTNENKSDEEKITCNVYYSAVPNYDSSELVPQTVTVNVKNCDGSIDEKIIVENTAPGYTIDYATGEYSKN